MFLLSEKEAKIAKEKALGIYKERKVTEFSLKSRNVTLIGDDVDEVSKT